MMEERLPLWEASLHGIIAGEIIASIVDIKEEQDSQSRPVKSSPFPEWKALNVIYRHQFSYEVYGDVYEVN